MARTSVVAVLAIASASAACREPTQVDVVLRTDVACADLEGVEVAVAPTPAAVESRAPGAATRTCASGAIGNIVLVPEDASDGTFSLRVVAGFKKRVEDCRSATDFEGRGPEGEGCIEAKRALAFIPHTPLQLPIDLRESCVGVSCPVDETCVGGKCVPAAIRCEEGEPCDEQVLVGTGGGGQGGSAGGAGGASGQGGAGGQGGAPDEVVAITAGHHASCARHASGNVVCWGLNNVGQLGNGVTGGSGLVPAFSPLPDIVSVGPAIGAQHGCVALGSAGGVHCAGQDGQGALGNGVGDMSSTTPVEAMLRSASRIEAGGLHVCALDSRGSPYCWGWNSSGQCAVPNNMPVETPTLIGPGSWKAISAGGVHSCAVDLVGEVLCWGSNVAFQSGQMVVGDVISPQKVLDNGLALKADDVSAGGTHTCALSGGAVSCWGRNLDGQLCVDPLVTMETHVPQACALPRQVLQVDAGGLGTCARAANDGVYCWGDHALLPDAPPVDTFEPYEVYDNAAEIAVGDDHACARTHGGQVFCWGRNDDGQVDGVPSPNQVLSPKQILGPP